MLFNKKYKLFNEVSLDFKNTNFFLIKNEYFERKLMKNMFKLKMNKFIFSFFKQDLYIYIFFTELLEEMQNEFFDELVNSNSKIIAVYFNRKFFYKSNYMMYFRSILINSKFFISSFFYNKIIVLILYLKLFFLKIISLIKKKCL